MACSACHAKKCACDGQRPCGRCVKFNEKCVDFQRKQRGRKAKAPAVKPGRLVDNSQLLTTNSGSPSATVSPTSSSLSSGEEDDTDESRLSSPEMMISSPAFVSARLNTSKNSPPSLGPPPRRVNHKPSHIPAAAASSQGLAMELLRKFTDEQQRQLLNEISQNQVKNLDMALLQGQQELLRLQQQQQALSLSPTLSQSTIHSILTPQLPARQAQAAGLDTLLPNLSTDLLSSGLQQILQQLADDSRRLSPQFSPFAQLPQVPPAPPTPPDLQQLLLQKQQLQQQEQLVQLLTQRVTLQTNTVLPLPQQIQQLFQTSPSLLSNSSSLSPFANLSTVPTAPLSVPFSSPTVLSNVLAALNSQPNAPQPINAQNSFGSNSEGTSPLSISPTDIQTMVSQISNDLQGQIQGLYASIQKLSGGNPGVNPVDSAADVDAGIKRLQDMMQQLQQSPAGLLDGGAAKTASDMTSSVPLTLLKREIKPEPVATVKLENRSPPIVETERKTALASANASKKRSPVPQVKSEAVIVTELPPAPAPIALPAATNAQTSSALRSASAAATSASMQPAVVQPFEPRQIPFPAVPAGSPTSSSSSSSPIRTRPYEFLPPAMTDEDDLLDPWNLIQLQSHKHVNFPPLPALPTSPRGFDSEHFPYHDVSADEFALLGPEADLNSQLSEELSHGSLEDVASQGSSQDSGSLDDDLRSVASYPALYSRAASPGPGPHSPMAMVEDDPASAPVTLSAGLLELWESSNNNEQTSTSRLELVSPFGPRRKQKATSHKRLPVQWLLQQARRPTKSIRYQPLAGEVQQLFSREYRGDVVFCWRSLAYRIFTSLNGASVEMFRQRCSYWSMRMSGLQHELDSMEFSPEERKVMKITMESVKNSAYPVSFDFTPFQCAADDTPLSMPTLTLQYYYPYVVPRSSIPTMYRDIFCAVWAVGSYGVFEACNMYAKASHQVSAPNDWFPQIESPEQLGRLFKALTMGATPQDAAKAATAAPPAVPPTACAEHPEIVVASDDVVSGAKKAAANPLGKSDAIPLTSIEGLTGTFIPQHSAASPLPSFLTSFKEYSRKFVFIPPKRPAFLASHVDPEPEHLRTTPPPTATADMAEGLAQSFPQGSAIAAVSENKVNVPTFHVAAIVNEAFERAFGFTQADLREALIRDPCFYFNGFMTSDTAARVFKNLWLGSTKEVWDRSKVARVRVFGHVIHKDGTHVPCLITVRFDFDDDFRLFEDRLIYTFDPLPMQLSNSNMSQGVSYAQATGSPSSSPPSSPPPSPPQSPSRATTGSRTLLGEPVASSTTTASSSSSSSTATDSVTPDAQHAQHNAWQVQHYLTVANQRQSYIPKPVPRK